MVESSDISNVSKLIATNKSFAHNIKLTKRKIVLNINYISEKYEV